VAPSQSRPVLGVAVLLGLVMMCSGVSKLVGEPHQVAAFARFGLPSWFRALTGSFELAGGLLLVAPATTPIGSLILSTIMVGAIWAHAAAAEWTSLVPVTVLLILFLVIFHRTRSRAVRLLGRVS
jgi:uncharacterized membrane protein YphA (DoxX/SURF4 family)